VLKATHPDNIALLHIQFMGIVRW